MMAPRYRDIQNSQVPEGTLDNGIKIKVVCGLVQGVQGPVRDIVTDPEYLDVSIPPGCEFIYPTQKGHTVLAYTIDGRGYFCKEKKPFSYEAEGVNYFDIQREPFIGDGTLVLFEDGEQIMASTENQSLRFLLISGKPLGEPIAWYGPIVMNTQDELRVAFEEFNNGTFIKHKK
jgi:quercetin 2,3-dioxygenase